MSARILDGLAVAAAIRAELDPQARAFASRAGRPPGLGIVLVGDNPASEVYVRNKLRTAADSGFRADLERLPADAPLESLLDVVGRLNASEVHDGILVQAPLPGTMGPGAAQRVFDAIDPAKDVDGFNPVNVGRLVQNRPTLAPCTPSGIVELLARSGIAMAGAHAVIVGRSEIVGKPMAMLLLHRDATVTVCHSKTPDLPAVCACGDILVAALGRPGFIRRAFVKPGATVVDVGISRITDRGMMETLFAPGRRQWASFEKLGAALAGDVHQEVEAVAGALTPVPGGVGPLTIAMLMKNTLAAAERRRARP